jgi:hypothetical protein
MTSESASGGLSAEQADATVRSRRFVALLVVVAQSLADAAANETERAIWGAAA